jgi:hypothetical protein
MTTRELHSYLTRRPFEPIWLVSSSGQTYDVRHPDAAILMDNGVLVAYGGRNGGLPELSAHLSSLHITAVETMLQRRPRRARKD